jgi:GNAT superfamily N-acetyltransferase
VNGAMVDQSMTPDSSFEIRQATAADVAMVTTILEEVASWVAMNQLEAWDPGFFSSDEGQRRIRTDIANGEHYIIRSDDTHVGTFVLRPVDEIFWPGAPPDALYLHRFAVLHAASGSGRRAIAWMLDECRSRGRAFLRLDCIDDNPGICRYYESLGCAPLGTVVVSGRRLRLYELRVGDERYSNAF